MAQLQTDFLRRQAVPLLGYGLVVLLGFGPQRVWGWDYEYHRLVNQLALASLPTNFHAFVRTPEARERIAFLGGEPDRWRNTPDLPLKHFNSPDHYIDLEGLALYGLPATNLSHLRYEFAAQLAAARATKAERFPPIDPLKDADRTKALVGFLPWAITEYYAKLKSQFSYLKAYQQDGTPEEIANAQQNIIYILGVMGHFVGDAAQPLHTTEHHHGWVGPNPRGYSTNYAFHAWIDGGFLDKAGLNRDELFARVRPASLLWKSQPRTPRPDVFPEVMAFILDQHRLVEPLFELDKRGQLTPNGDSAQAGRAFLGQQLLKGGQFLGDLWLTAAEQAPPDAYLKSQLAKRKAARTNSPPRR